MTSTEQIDTALAIADLVDHQSETVRAIQGYLLQKGIAGEEVTPQTLAREVAVTPETARDVFRQLESAGASERCSYPSDPLGTTYACNEEVIATLCETTVTAIEIVSEDQKRRQQPTKVQPLVTLPADPAFQNVMPGEFGFDWLMPELSGAINQADDRIRILMPFFESGGFEELEPGLMSALERGVSVTIVARYLSDEESHNYSVLSGFVEECRDRGVPLAELELIDYTAWDSDDETGQHGDRPSFTLHAKIMLFDTDRAYVGSANVTDYGFERYLEVGVLLEGPAVSSFDDLVSRLHESPAATNVRF
jgi:putative cardiolipin synthase